MTSVRFPLSVKILLWLFCNLVLLGVVLYGFFLFQFRVGLDSLLAGQAASRLDSLANVVESELRETPPSEWNTVLDRFGSAYEGVDFYLFGPNGTQLAGTPVQLPPVLRKRMLGFRGRPEPEGRPWRQRPPQGAERRPGPPPHRPHAKFMVRTEDPVRYWMGVRLPPARHGFAPGEPMMLFAVSNTQSGGGLFFDAGPWVAVGFGALALTVLFWLPLIRGITRSLGQITRATEQVAEGNFEIRVDATRLDELGRLGQAINAMTERLAGFVSGQKRFLGDAAHELCSPLARTEVALSLLETQADASLQPRIADVREEAQEMASLVNEILAFSKAGLRGSETRCEPVALAELVARVAAREAPEGEPQVKVEIDEHLQALAAPGLLGRAVANLIRNAVRHAGEAGPIIVRAEARERAIALTVSDSGPGVPEEALPKLFDPFFRLDVSRSRDTGGVGLGLAIVKTCVEACGGSVMARNRTPKGLQVEITLQQA